MNVFAVIHVIITVCSSLSPRDSLPLILFEVLGSSLGLPGAVGG